MVLPVTTPRGLEASVIPARTFMPRFLVRQDSRQRMSLDQALTIEDIRPEDRIYAYLFNNAPGTVGDPLESQKIFLAQNAIFQGRTPSMPLHLLTSDKNPKKAWQPAVFLLLMGSANHIPGRGTRSN